MALLCAAAPCAWCDDLTAQTAATPSPAAPPTATQAPANPAVPEWAYPGTANRPQVAPPPDFRRASTHFAIPIGIFEGQSDVGTAVVPGSASYDPATKQYTISSAGYNVWYYRDEFRFLWKKMSGDVSLAADVAYPDPTATATARRCSSSARISTTTRSRSSSRRTAPA